MLNRDLVIIGGGPAGLSAAIAARDAGQSSLIIDRSPALGGQLIKQTHMFFGSEKQHAKTRGTSIAKMLIEEVNKSELIEVWTNSTVVGLYEDRVLTITNEKEEYIKVKAKAIIVATGASEKFLAFENNDLPGIYGAGAVQTLMNVYGVKPGNEVIMVGSGNIGLIVSYQLLQAGIKVAAVIEASENIGGFKVHASKLRRYGIPIHTSTTIKRAIGTNRVEQVETIKVNSKWEEIPGSEEIYNVDSICIAVGLTPMVSLLAMIGVELKYISELGGLVPVISKYGETSLAGIYACGDAASVEEASSAMVEGSIAGLKASEFLGKKKDNFVELLNNYLKDLNNLREGPFGLKIRQGLEKLGGHENVE